LPEPTVLKVLVLYTPNVTKLAGGEDNMALFLSRVQEQTNQGYRQSDIEQLRVKITGWKEVDYIESGVAEQDLKALTEFAIEKQLRKTFQADAVSLWVTKLNDACGLGNLIKPLLSFNNTPSRSSRLTVQPITSPLLMNWGTTWAAATIVTPIRIVAVRFPIPLAIATRMASFARLWRMNARRETTAHA